MKAKYSYWPFSVFGEIPLDNFPNELRKFVVCSQEDYAISIRIDRSIDRSNLSPARARLPSANRFTRTSSTVTRLYKDTPRKMFFGLSK